MTFNLQKVQLVVLNSISCLDLLDLCGHAELTARSWLYRHQDNAKPTWELAFHHVETGESAAEQSSTWKMIVNTWKPSSQTR